MDPQIEAMLEKATPLAKVLANGIDELSVRTDVDSLVVMTALRMLRNAQAKRVVGLRDKLDDLEKRIDEAYFGKKGTTIITI